MAGEYWWLRRRAARNGPTAGDYEKRDTLPAWPWAWGAWWRRSWGPKLLGPFTPGRGRYGKAVVVGALGAAATTTVADIVARWIDEAEREPAAVNGSAVHSGHDEKRDEHTVAARVARRVSSVGGVIAVVAGGVAITTTWASRTTPSGCGGGGSCPTSAPGQWRWRRPSRPGTSSTTGTTASCTPAATCGRSTSLHHSSEHYNLSTALRQPVAEAFGTFVPFGSLCLFGISRV